MIGRHFFFTSKFFQLICMGFCNQKKINLISTFEIFFFKYRQRIKSSIRIYNFFSILINFFVEIQYFVNKLKKNSNIHTIRHYIIYVIRVQTSANEKTRFSFVCSFVNKRQTNANEKTKKTKYTNDKQTKKTLYSVCLNFLKLIFLKKILCN